VTKTALVTGITGQDGAYLARLLLDKGYKVFGAYRRASTLNLWRLQFLGINGDSDSLPVVELELLEDSNIRRAIEKVKPDEVYNLAAQSFVGVSFEQPIYTGQVDGIGVARLLEAIRDVNPRIRFYQASTSEMFGSSAAPQSELTPFHPRSPYGIAKLYAHWMTVNYREAHGMFACNGILFNHESPLRGLEFVTRKITHGFANIKAGKQEAITLGNLDARRDWGYAKDYVEGMWMMLQQPAPRDYVLATGQSASVRDFCNLAASAVDIFIEWQGEGAQEKGIDAATGETVVHVSNKHYRPAEVDLLIGDPYRARTEMEWEAKTTLPSLVSLMVKADVERAA
jgi:GDPmannose 4,6-dehydratase